MPSLASARPLRSLLFSFEGGVNRSTWWATILGWYALAAFTTQIQGKHPVVGAWLLVVLFVWLWPILAITVKRWHDRGKSGVWCFIVLLPMIGSFIALLELGVLGQTRDFTSRFYLGPKSYRARRNAEYLLRTGRYS